jgi:hypothetical protein
VSDLAAMLSGAIAAGDLVAGAFFLRFWTRTRDRLFLAFAAAFGLLAANQILVGIYGSTAEGQAPFYLLRLTAFGLIILAIIRKNMNRD